MKRTVESIELETLATFTAARQRRTWLLVGAMLLTVALVAALAFWDSERQAEATLSDFAQEQATLASSVAADLGNRLQSARRDALLAAEQTLTGHPISPRLREPYLSLQVEPASAPDARPAPRDDAVLVQAPIDAERRISLRVSLAQLFSGLHQLERQDELIVLIAPPGALEAQTFYTTAGKQLRSALLSQALAEPQSFILVPRQKTAHLGLPSRMALAGFSHYDGGPLGTWHVAAVCSALRERDRNRWSRWRAVFTILLAGGLVLLFGGVALVTQRKELEMERAGHRRPAPSARRTTFARQQGRDHGNPGAGNHARARDAAWRNYRTRRAAAGATVQ